MNRLEAAAAWATAFLMLSAGLVWRFGFYGLVGPGLALLIAMVFIDVKE